ncbi:MAG TPA: exo-alpha-sialidase [Anaerolineales bacterium]|nr:exo-alpha-sialidase [Anaerolineales bacterium]
MVLNSLILVCLVLAGFGLPNVPPASAQFASDAWTQPVNLSKSGSTVNPYMAVDNEGIIHVVWFDTFSGMVYSRLEENQWSEPIPVEFPFEEISVDPSLPLILMGDDNAYIHAFWINGLDELNYSRVPARNFGNAAAWESARILAESAVGMDVSLQGRNFLHVAYVRPLDTDGIPAGIYYRQSNDGGVSWTSGQALYRSSYIRALTTDNAHVDIASTNLGEETHVYVAWDDPLLKRVYLSKSINQGSSWAEPVEIDGPSASTIVSTPFSLKVAPREENVLLVWNSGLQSGFDCTQYYQSSVDGGATWSERQVMLDDLVGCPQENKIYSIQNDFILMHTIVQDEVYFLAWNGSQWSQPQPQGTLYSFTDQETFVVVNLRCRNTLLTGGDRLFVVGCDVVGSGDIWFTSRSLSSISEWFPPPTVWSRPEKIASAELQISSATSVVDLKGRVWYFWVQTEEESDVNLTEAIYNIYWDKASWSKSSRVLKSPDGKADNLDVAVDSSGRVMAVWNGTASGELYFSWADTDFAGNPSEWARVKTLPVPRIWAHAPDIYIDATDRIYVTYSLPYNEDRGIYLTTSDDGGENWLQPVKVFDAVAADWNGADNPLIEQTPDGELHIFWRRTSFPDGGGPEELYYARSVDRGQQWSQPELVADVPVRWFDIISTQDGFIHRFWQSQIGMLASIWHETSLDQGLTWSVPENLSRFGETPDYAGLVSDSAGRIHLLQVAEGISGELMLIHWIWEAEKWVSEESLTLGSTNEIQVTSLSPVMSSDGRIGVLYSSQVKDVTEATSITNFSYASRLVELPEELQILTQNPTPSLATPNPVTPASSPEATVEIGASPTPEPTSNLAEILNPQLARTPTVTPGGSGSSGFLSNSWVGLGLGGLAAAVIGIVLWISRKNLFRRR